MIFGPRASVEAQVAAAFAVAAVMGLGLAAALPADCATSRSAVEGSCGTAAIMNTPRPLTAREPDADDAARPGLSRGRLAGRAAAGSVSGRRRKKPPAHAAPHPVAPSSVPVVSSPASSNLRRHQIVRIGLSTARDKVVIASPSGAFRILDPVTTQPVWHEAFTGPVTIGVRGAPPTSGRLYRAQVGSFDVKDAAEQLAARLRADLSIPVIVAWSPDRKVWRIRAGEADSREGLAEVMAKLRAAGYPDAWIADEPMPQKDASSLVLVDPGYDTFAVPGRAVTIATTTEGAVLSVDGVTYRGSLEVRLDASGGLRVIDSLPIESYLRGVVPSELGPDVYPEIEALKAQTIAARTYIYRNLGQFADEGFDLCDTPRCQVYSGVKAEHPLSDRAIAETEGEVATYQGAPINAMYTSTCGGHTEDAAEIFPENTAPYLVGVPCAPEERSRKQRRILLSGDPALVSAPDARGAEAVALLVVHGILDRAAAASGASLASPVSASEAAAWIESVGAGCGAPRAPGSSASPPLPGSTQPTLAALASQLVTRMGWKGRVDLLIAPEDPQSWLRDEFEDLPQDQATATAYFVRTGGWPQAVNGRIDPDRMAKRGELAQLLLAAAKDCDATGLHEAMVRGGDSGSLRLTVKGAPEAHPLAEGALIFADFGSGPVPMRRVGLVAGDKLRFHVNGGGSIDLMTLAPGREGLSDDRYSNLSSWTVAYSAEDLAKRLNEYLGSGARLVDIAPVRRGVSGRVTELKITGSGGDSFIRGFSIRTALGLRENLFTIDKQTGPDGAIKRVVFTGRGWGHGIGMCQVGAYGMALRGLSYKEILTHYYSGIRIEKLP